MEKEFEGQVNLFYNLANLAVDKIIESCIIFNTEVNRDLRRNRVKDTGGKTGGNYDKSESEHQHTEEDGKDGRGQQPPQRQDDQQEGEGTPPGTVTMGLQPNWVFRRNLQKEKVTWKL
jgi:hypothetical protein